MASIRYSAGAGSGTVAVTGTAATFSVSQTGTLYAGYRFTASGQTFTLASGSGTSWVTTAAAAPDFGAIAFTYEVVLQSDYNAIAGGVGARFRNWTPMQMPVGPAVNALGTGTLYRYAFRTDYGASFTMPELPNDEATMVTMLRVQAWLMNGNAVTVVTDDSSSRTYTNCGLAPDTQPEITLDNPQDLRYAMGFSLINLSAAPMLCTYANS